jgi:hypothetical protein
MIKTLQLGTFSPRVMCAYATHDARSRLDQDLCLRCAARRTCAHAHAHTYATHARDAQPPAHARQKVLLSRENRRDCDPIARVGFGARCPQGPFVWPHSRLQPVFSVDDLLAGALAVHIAVTVSRMLPVTVSVILSPPTPFPVTVSVFHPNSDVPESAHLFPPESAEEDCSPVCPLVFLSSLPTCFLLSSPRIT